MFLSILSWVASILPQFSTQLARNKNNSSSTQAMHETHRSAVRSHDDHGNFDGKPYSPRHPTGTMAISESPSTREALTVPKSNVWHNDNPSSTTSKTLCEFPTRICSKSSTNAIIDLHVEDVYQHLHQKECHIVTPTPTFLQKWNDFHSKFNDFYNEFVNSTTFTLANDASITLHNSLIEDNNDQSSSLCDSLTELHQAARELAKVNCQLFQLFKTLNTPASCKQPHHDTFGTLQQPAQCTSPQIERIAQCVILGAPPPAHNPKPNNAPCKIPRPQSSKTTILNQTIMVASEHVLPHQLPPPAPNLAAGINYTSNLLWPLP